MSNVDFETIKADAQGKWPGILSALGIDVSENQKKHTPCPVCGGTDRFRFTNETGAGEWFCNQCDPKAGTGIDLVKAVMNVDVRTAFLAVESVIGTAQPSAFQKEKPVDPEMLRAIFKASAPVEVGDPVQLYLKNRGLTSMPPTLRYCEKCYEPETKEEQHAMLAVFALPDGTAVTMHRTFITEDGQKLDVAAPKMFLPALKKLNGGAVRLYPVEPIIGVCEGIETAIAIHGAMRKFPIWPVIGTSLMEAFEPPAGVECVIIYADNDLNYAGQKAAFALANRLVIKNKIRADVEIPDMPGEDFLDEINREAE